MGCKIEHMYSLKLNNSFPGEVIHLPPRNILKRDKLINSNVKREHISDERDTLSYGEIEEKILHISKRHTGYRV